MTICVTEIKQCPNCKSEFATWDVVTRNTFGAKFFTDGSVKGSMYSTSAAVLACPRCQNHFWRKDARTKKRLGMTEDIKNADGQSIPFAMGVYGSAYNELLRQGFWKSEAQEKHIRIRAWWSFNSVYRGDEIQDLQESPEYEETFSQMLELLAANDTIELIQRPEVLQEYDRIHDRLDQLRRPREEWHATQDFEMSAEQEENLSRLLQLLNPNDSNESIMMAEIMRELGQFDSCLKQLDQPFQERHMTAVNVIKNLALNKKRMVAAIE